tara:strand:- start:556 stop:1227 length:672 start_codon:yes stop_codon:yes gene_type:complete
MKKSSLNFYTLIFKLTLKNYSPLRIFQILEIKKLAIDEEFLDLGSTFSDTNVSNFIEKTHLRNFATLNTKEKLENHINLEEYPNEIEKKFKVVLLMNVLEHIKNINNCFKNINYLLEKKGTLYGSTPFIYHIHESPNDYFRFTKQFLNEFLIENDFTNVEIKTLGTGIFCNMYSSLFNHTKRIPLLNVLLFPTVIIIDKFISIFFKNLKNINPLGYFFVAKKN